MKTLSETMNPFSWTDSAAKKLPLHLTEKPISVDSPKKAESLERGQRGQFSFSLCMVDAACSL